MIRGRLGASPHHRRAAVTSLILRIGRPLPHHSLHFLRLAGERAAADVAVWQEATSVCQLSHKYKQGRGSIYGVPARGPGMCHDIIMPQMIGGNSQVVFHALPL